MQREYERRYFKNPENKRKRVEIVKRWGVKHPDLVKKYARSAYLKRQFFPKNRIYSALGRQIWSAIKSQKSNRRWESLVGYSLSDLMIHLAARFDGGMNWNNYGKYGWHIDHIIPASWFIFSKPEDPGFKMCWELHNLQPKWASENISKGNRYVG